MSGKWEAGGGMRTILLSLPPLESPHLAPRTSHIEPPTPLKHGPIVALVA